MQMSTHSKSGSTAGELATPGAPQHAPAQLPAAVYGDLKSFPTRCIDVRAQLSGFLTLYDNYYLRLPADLPKYKLPGIWDPCPGYKKQLKVRWTVLGANGQPICAESSALLEDTEMLEIMHDREQQVSALLACQPPQLHLTEDAARMAALLRTFAPEVRFHPDEVYYPCPVDWYLRNAELFWDAKTGFNFSSHPRILARLDNFDSLAVRYVWKDTLYHSHRLPNDFYLTPQKDRAAFVRSGFREPSRGPGGQPVPVYGHVLQYRDTHEIDLQYWFFYGYNGPIVSWLPAAGVHEADWEHVTVRLAPDAQSIRAIFYDAYEWEGKWVLQPASSVTARDGYTLVHGTHPLVFAAKHSHTSYPWAGLHKRRIAGVVDEVTEDYGTRWQTWEHVLNVGDAQQPRDQQSWVQYAGLWGAPPRSPLEYCGKRGPAFLKPDTFASGDPPLAHDNCVPPQPRGAADPFSRTHTGLSRAEMQRALVADGCAAFEFRRWRPLPAAPAALLAVSLGSGPYALLVDSHGALHSWRCGRFARLPRAPPRLVAVSVGPDNLAWLLDADGAVYREMPSGTPGGSLAALLDHDPAASQWLKSADVSLRCITACGGGRAWAVDTDGQLRMWLPAAFAWQLATPAPPNGALLQRLSFSRDGTLWAVAANGNLLRMPPNDSQWVAKSASALVDVCAPDANTLWVLESEYNCLVSQNGSDFRDTHERFHAIAVNPQGFALAVSAANRDLLKRVRQRLLLLPVRSFVKVWDDAGLETLPHLSLFRPVPPKGYFILGDYAELSTFNSPSDQACVLVASEERDPDDVDAVPLLAPPVGYELVWTTAGSKARKSCSLWRPIPPDGYAALGHVVTPGIGGMKPDCNLQCVHLGCLAAARLRTFGSEKCFWTDKRPFQRNNSAGIHVSLWAVGGAADAPADSEPRERDDAAAEGLPAGTFLASSGYAPPPHNVSPAFCFMPRPNSLA